MGSFESNNTTDLTEESYVTASENIPIPTSTVTDSPPSLSVSPDSAPDYASQAASQSNSSSVSRYFEDDGAISAETKMVIQEVGVCCWILYFSCF